MATRPDIISPFIDKLLAPLPASEEQADTPKFRKQIERDVLAVWSAGMDRVQLAVAVHAQAALLIRMKGEKGPQHFAAEADFTRVWRARVEAEIAQCLIPSPTMKELRWKRKSLGNAPVNKEAVAAIEADARRLGCS